MAVARSVFIEVRDVRDNLVHDAHTAILMREHGIREMYPRDTTSAASRSYASSTPWREPVGRPMASTSSTHVAAGRASRASGPRAAPPSGRGR